MNVASYNFILFVLWAGMALVILVIGPYFAPKLLPQSVKNNPLIGYLAAAFALWKLARWWSVRSYVKQHQQLELMEEAYRLRTDPLAPENTKPVVLPEFKFDNEPGAAQSDERNQQ
jgi:hypothetical protein